MQLVSMKKSPEEMRESKDTACCAPESDQPAYPYGLRIDLNDETLAKLGVTELPAVGTTMKLMALVEVTSASQYESKDGKDRTICLQITDMAVDSGAAPAARSDSDIASSLYR